MEENIMHRGYFYTFQDCEIPDLVNLGHYGFEFDWSLQSDPNSLTVSFIYEGTVYAMVEFAPKPTDFYNEILLLETSSHCRNMGLGGKMMAYVAQDAFDRGFDGFMMVISKTATRKFYINKLGGKQIGNTHRIQFDREASQKIIERYGDKK